MHERKKQVLRAAHQLFIDKGFHQTSINAIIEYSDISKGTFYNYFSSKNELLMELFKTNFKQMEKKRDELLIGQDRSDIEVFIKQIELLILTNRKNNLISLLEEIVISDDEELKLFFKKGQLKMLKWLYSRFIDLFGKKYKPYLLDYAIMFTGILNHFLNYYTMIAGTEKQLHVRDVVRYSVNRITDLVEKVDEKKEQLFRPDLLEKWLPEAKVDKIDCQKRLHRTILTLKKSVRNRKEEEKYIELLDFIYDELLGEKEDAPRSYLIQMALQTLKANSSYFDEKTLNELEQIVTGYLQTKEKD